MSLEIELLPLLVVRSSGCQGPSGSWTSFTLGLERDWKDVGLLSLPPPTHPPSVFCQLHTISESLSIVTHVFLTLPFYAVFPHLAAEPAESTETGSHKDDHHSCHRVYWERKATTKTTTNPATWGHWGLLYWDSVPPPWGTYL